MIAWSPHAKELLRSILATIRFEQSTEDAYRWNDKIAKAVETLGDFPLIGRKIPIVCFATIPENSDNLRQIFCLPYRIIYEVAAGEIHILSIRHSRMLVTSDDTIWN